MNPKFIIIKIKSKKLYNQIYEKLKEYERIHFFKKKINGIYTIIIKCENFYNSILETNCSDNIYQTYIYLYTNISIILSKIIIDFYELKLTNQILYSQHKDISSYSFNRLKNILRFVLDSNFPSSESKKLYLYRKDLILSKLLLNFRNHNYIYLEHFVYFKLRNYYEHLENIVEKTYAKY